MIYTQSRIHHAWNSLRFCDTNWLPNRSQKTRPRDNKKRELTVERIFVVPRDPRVKINESEKWHNYLNLARELKMLWNVWVTVIPIVIGTLGIVSKGEIKGPEELEIGGRADTIQTTALLRMARIERRVLETWGDFLTLVWKTCKEYNNNKNNNNNHHHHNNNNNNPL